MVPIRAAKARAELAPQSVPIYRVPENNGASAFVLPPNGLVRPRNPLRFEICHCFFAWGNSAKAEAVRHVRELARAVNPTIQIATRMREGCPPLTRVSTSVRLQKKKKKTSWAR